MTAPVKWQTVADEGQRALDALHDMRAAAENVTDPGCYPFVEHIKKLIGNDLSGLESLIDDARERANGSQMEDMIYGGDPFSGDAPRDGIPMAWKRNGPLPRDVSLPGEMSSSDPYDEHWFDEADR